MGSHLPGCSPVPPVSTRKCGTKQTASRRSALAAIVAGHRFASFAAMPSTGAHQPPIPGHHELAHQQLRQSTVVEWLAGSGPLRFPWCASLPAPAPALLKQQPPRATAPSCELADHPARPGGPPRCTWVGQRWRGSQPSRQGSRCWRADAGGLASRKGGVLGEYAEQRPGNSPGQR